MNNLLKYLDCFITDFGLTRIFISLESFLIRHHSLVIYNDQLGFEILSFLLKVILFCP